MSLWKIWFSLSFHSLIAFITSESATFIIDAVPTTSLIKLVDLETNAISKELPKSNPSKATIRTTTARPVSKTTITTAMLTSSNLQTSENSANPSSTTQKKKQVGLGTIHDGKWRI